MILLPIRIKFDFIEYRLQVNQNIIIYLKLFIINLNLTVIISQKNILFMNFLAQFGWTIILVQYYNFQFNQFLIIQFYFNRFIIIVPFIQIRFIIIIIIINLIRPLNARVIIIIKKVQAHFTSIFLLLLYYYLTI